MTTPFTPLLSLGGGFLIGLAATLYMALHGRIVGMTGIVGGIIPPVAADWRLRLAFVIGAIVAPMAFAALGGRIAFAVPVSSVMLALGGFIVGIGANLGSGCTSGHGVCGMARLSPRSIAATATFMAAAFVTVFVVRHVVGL